MTGYDHDWMTLLTKYSVSSHNIAATAKHHIITNRTADFSNAARVIGNFHYYLQSWKLQCHCQAQSVTICCKKKNIFVSKNVSLCLCLCIITVFNGCQAASIWISAEKRLKILPLIVWQKRFKTRLRLIFHVVIYKNVSASGGLPPPRPPANRRQLDPPGNFFQFLPCDQNVCILFWAGANGSIGI